jgi:hypothetical protein
MGGKENEMTNHIEKGSDWLRALAILIALGILANGCSRATGPPSVPTKGVTVAISQSDEDTIRGLLAELLGQCNRSWSSGLEYLDSKPYQDLLRCGWKAVPYLIEQVALREAVDAYIGSALIDDPEVDTPKEVYDYNLARQRAVDAKTLGPHVLASLLDELPCGNGTSSLDTPGPSGGYNRVYAWLDWWQDNKGGFAFQTKQPPVIGPSKDKHSLVPQINVTYDENNLPTLYAVHSTIEDLVERGAAAMRVSIVVPEPHGRQPSSPMSGITTIRMKSVTVDEFVYRIGRMIWGIPYDKMDEKLQIGPAILQLR